MSVKRDIVWRIWLAFFAVCLIGVAIMVQAFRIQVLQGAHWRNLADSTTTVIDTIDAERGNILAENGELLATSLPYFDVHMDLLAEGLTDDVFFEGVDSLSLGLANLFGEKSQMDWKHDLITARNNGARYFKIKTKVNYRELEMMKTFPLFKLGQYQGGLVIEQINKREMPFQNLAHRTIGYTRDDISIGIEGTFDEILSGVKGLRLKQRVSGNFWVPVSSDADVEPKNGKDIVTTIDINLQDVAENALHKALTTHHADYGCVILMEVKTGKIKAIANLGLTKGIDDSTNNWEYAEMYNYAIGSRTEPGSTFKLASLMACIEDDLIDVQDSVDLQYGQVHYYDRTMYDSKLHNIRNVTIEKAFAMSSNVGISKVLNEQYATQPKKFIERLQQFHLTVKTGIEIKGEEEPLVKTPGTSEWYGTTLPWMSVGYEVEVTPLQLLTFYNTVANDGKMMKPYLVSAIQEYGKNVTEYEPEVIDEKICSDKTITIAKELLAAVIDEEEGTGAHLHNADYEIAGKTSTAKKLGDGGYQKEYQASFVGYFPADAPQYSCIVVISRPRNGVYYGGYVAGPVFREIADKIYSTNLDWFKGINEEENLSVEKSYPKSKAGNVFETLQAYAHLNYFPKIQAQDAEWIYCSLDSNGIKLNERTVIENLVPNVVGMGLKDALVLLENHGLSVSVAGRGKVYKQSVMAGSNFQKGDHIIIELI